LTTQLIYDDDILIGGEEAVEENGEIISPEIKGSPGTQFREIFALGLSFTL